VLILETQNGAHIRDTTVGSTDMTYTEIGRCCPVLSLTLM